MNKLPIDQARDSDLRFSQQALERAAHRAHELARSTGTFIVVSRNGVVEHLTPASDKVTDSK
jgi:hypothetical protein